MTNPFLLYVTREMVDRRKAPLEAWRDSTMGANEDLGYDSYIASVDAAIANWELVKYFAEHGSSDLRVRWVGCLDSENDNEGEALQFEPVIQVDCARTTDLPAQIIEATGNTDFQRGRDISQAAEELWATLDEIKNAEGQSLSPICNGRLYAPVPGAEESNFMQLDFQGRGVVFQGSFYWVMTGFSLTSFFDAGVPEDTEFTVSWADGENLYRFPSPHDYAVAKTELDGDVKTEGGLDVRCRVKGRLPDVPDDFGATIVSAEFYDPFGEGVNGWVKSWGGPKIDDAYSWAGKWWRKGDGAVILGFEDFAGRYYDHPIVTGVNGFTPETRPVSDLEEINDYVNTNFGHIEDGENYDNWQFLNEFSNPSGDCEDFALTKIQMLLDLGWDIDRLQLMAGETDGGIGHAWVLVDGVYVLDNDFGSVTTIDAMVAKGYKKLRDQKGLWWRAIGWNVDPGSADIPEYDTAAAIDVGFSLITVSGKSYAGTAFKAIPWPHHDFDSYALSLKIRHRDWDE